jgi:hypothetical protein
MPNPSSGPIALSQINNAGATTNSMGSLVNEVIGGNSAANQQIAMSQFYFTFTNTLRTSFIENSNFVYNGSNASSPLNNGQWLGYAIAMSSNGQTAAVINGLSQFSDNTFPPVQRLFIYTRSGSTWSLQQTLTTTFWRNSFGREQIFTSVALSANGNTMAVGLKSTPLNNGRVEIYVRSGSTWALQQSLVGSPSAIEQYMGGTVALSASGDILAAGASGADDRGVYVWIRSGSTWTQQAILTGFAVGSPFVDTVSVSLSADGLTLAAGNSAANRGPYFQQGNGLVKVYIFTAGSWVLQTTILPTPATINDKEFGRAVSLSADGNTLAIGAPGTPANVPTIGNHGNIGAVTVYRRTGSTWAVQLNEFTPSNFIYPQQGKGYDYGPRIGASLSLSGDGSYLVVGAPQQPQVFEGISCGAYWIFSRSGSTWTQVSGPNYPPGTYASNYSSLFGNSVVLSSNSNYLTVGQNAFQAFTNVFTGKVLMYD